MKNIYDILLVFNQHECNLKVLTFTHLSSFITMNSVLAEGFLHLPLPLTMPLRLSLLVKLATIINV